MMKTMTQIKKTIKMLRKYCTVAKMPKGWVHAAIGDDEEVQIKGVWQKQKKALSDSTTCGINRV